MPDMPHSVHWIRAFQRASAPLSLCVIRLRTDGYHVLVPTICLVYDYRNHESMTFKNAEIVTCILTCFKGTKEVEQH